VGIAPVADLHRATPPGKPTTRLQPRRHRDFGALPLIIEANEMSAVPPVHKTRALIPVLLIKCCGPDSGHADLAKSRRFIASRHQWFYFPMGGEGQNIVRGC
jgi:hypothetical protein